MAKRSGLPEHVHWLKDRCVEWHCPTVAYESKRFATNYDVLGCTKMDVSVDCYFSTAVVSIHGEWKNYLQDDLQDFVFVLKTRGYVTDCTIKIIGKHVRTVAILTNETIDRNTNTKGTMDQAKIEIPSIKSKRVIELLPEWTEKEHEIFQHSSKSYFFLPFQDVGMNDIIHIDCEYVESMRVIQGYYYIDIPLTFYDSQTGRCMIATNNNKKERLNSDAAGDSDNNKNSNLMNLQSQIMSDSEQNDDNKIDFENIVSVRCRINHTNSMGVQDVKCPSHKIKSIQTETNHVLFETGYLNTKEAYYQNMVINSTMYGSNTNFPRFCEKLIHEDSLHIDEEVGIHYGRAFELFFRYGATSNLDTLAIEKSSYEAKWGNEGDIGHYVSIHGINNPLRQHFNYRLSQARHRESTITENNNRKNTNENGNNNNNNNSDTASNLDTSLASLGLFMTVTDPLSIRSNLPHRACCLYLVINNTSSMKNCWEDSIIDAIISRISRLHILDAFGICLFNELGVRHFVSINDESRHENKRADNNNDNDDDDEESNIIPPYDGACGHDSKTPKVYRISEWSNMDNSSGNASTSINSGQGGSSISSVSFSKNSGTWRNMLKQELRDWLQSRQPKTRKEIHHYLKMFKHLKVNGEFNENGSFGVNISTPLIQTLTYLESDIHPYKEHFFRQIAFIHHGNKNEIRSSKRKNSKNKKESKNKNENQNNNKLINDDSKDNNGDDVGDKVLGLMKEMLVNTHNFKSNLNINDNKEDIIDSTHDLGEHDLMNKIAFFYSLKAKEFLNMQPYSTRIYTIGLGNHTNLAFLEYLARNTRAFSARCFDPLSFKWDLVHFLDSISAPFITFDNDEIEPIKFIYSINAKLNSSHLSFPFPMPDLYLDRPLVLKFYIESPSKLKQLIVNGSYLKQIRQSSINNNNGNYSSASGMNSVNLLTSMNNVGSVSPIQSPTNNSNRSQQASSTLFNIIREHAYGHLENNDVLDNDEFPLETLLANEEIDYWHGDYWFKHNNWLARINKTQDNNNNINPFTLFGSVDKSHAERIIGDLSDQTGIPSIFRTLVSFCMTPTKYNEYTKQIENEKEQSKTQMSQLSQSVTTEEKQNLLLGQLWHGANNNNNNNNNGYSNVNNASSIEQSSVQISSQSNNHNSSMNNNNNINLSVNNDNNNNNSNRKESANELKRMRNGMNKKGIKNNKNKISAVAAVAALGTIGVATLLNPFDGSGSGDDDFFGIDFNGGGDSVGSTIYSILCCQCGSDEWGDDCECDCDCDSCGCLVM